MSAAGQALAVTVPFTVIPVPIVSVALEGRITTLQGPDRHAYSTTLVRYGLTPKDHSKSPADMAFVTNVMLM